jgi:hypothetical protein
VRHHFRLASQLRDRYTLPTFRENRHSPASRFILSYIRCCLSRSVSSVENVPSYRSRPARWCIVALVAAAYVSSNGCVRRRMTINSNPPGAVVYVDDRDIGKTPVSTPFTYYGTREIQLVKDGYETLTVQQRFPPSWYQVPPLDFFSENLWPWELRDERIVNLEMAPQKNISTDEILRRGENLRQTSTAGFIAPLPATNPPTMNQPPVANPASPNINRLPPP